MDTTKKYNWHKISDSIEALHFGDSELIEREVAGKKICIGLHKGKLAACAAKCPHAGGILADGYIDNMGNIVCPIHRYRFNLQNGRNSSGEGYYLRTWPIEQRADGIYVGIEESSLFNWLK